MCATSCTNWNRSFSWVSYLFRALAPETYQRYRKGMDRLANKHTDLATDLRESPCPFFWHGIGMQFADHTKH